MAEKKSKAQRSQVGFGSTYKKGSDSDAKAQQEIAAERQEQQRPDGDTETGRDADQTTV